MGEPRDRAVIGLLMPGHAFIGEGIARWVGLLGLEPLAAAATVPRAASSE